MAAQVGIQSESTIRLNEEDLAYLMNLLRNATEPVTTQQLIDALRRQSAHVETASAEGDSSI